MLRLNIDTYRPIMRSESAQLDLDNLSCYISFPV